MSIDIYVLEALERYVKDGIEPGSFTRAVLENDLRKAIKTAHVLNRQTIPDIIEWLDDNAPASCWGSAFRVEKWMSDKGWVSSRQRGEPCEGDA